MHTYSQGSGEWRCGKTLLAVGYSGGGEGKNNPSMQGVRSVGPVPRGRWTILGPPFKHEHAGDCVMRLVPLDPDPKIHGEPWETDPLGRSGFLIHGDSLSRPGQASQGCIILPRGIRLAIWETGDRELEVVA